MTVDHELERAIDGAGRAEVFAYMEAAGWNSEYVIPKWVWWEAVRLVRLTEPTMRQPVDQNGYAAMTDLIERVTTAMAAGIAQYLRDGHSGAAYANSQQQEYMARAAIAAVLDDLMGALEADFPRMEDSTIDLNHYGAVKMWLTAKRRELGLDEPGEPTQPTATPDTTGQP